MDKIRDEEKLDGYYAIVTSELDESDDRIIEIYRGLWRIEESFKITKSLLSARPDANNYLFDYADEITDDLDAEFNVGFGNKYMTLGEIKKKFGMVKKG